MTILPRIVKGARADGADLSVKNVHKVGTIDGATTGARTHRGRRPRPDTGTGRCTSGRGRGHLGKGTLHTGTLHADRPPP